ncbi:MAG: hypothetical protein H6563_02155 [Lewinellaceae bacterium]|nr:hypothetical protein [Lewinellaceae bacterium]
MKFKKSFRIPLLFLAFLALGLQLQAQGDAPRMGKALADKEGKVMIQSGPLCYDNVIDLSSVDASIRSNVKAHFSGKNTQLVTFVVDENKGQVHVQIELRAQPDWTVEDWNKYLSSL